MELRHLRYFVAVAEELHFSRAAARLGVAQPPLSQQIKQLEEELGVPLLRRTSRRVSLTESGRVFLDRARRLLEQAEGAVDAARDAADGHGGHVRVSFVGTAALGVMAPILKAFRESYRDVELSLTEMPTNDQIK